MKHAILEEVPRTRDKLSEQCGYDVTKLPARIRRLEKQYADRLVRFPSRRKVVNPKAPKEVAAMREAAVPYRTGKPKN